MHTPVAALSWELWRRHRKRLIAIVGLFLGFALVYPKLCASAGIDVNSPDVLEDFVRTHIAVHDIEPAKFLYVLYLIFLLISPVLGMFLTLLYVIWMCTFMGGDLQTKDPMRFPTRLFSLPVSTNFLFGWFVIVGVAGIVVVYESWARLVPMPHIHMFDTYGNCLGWLALLALVQGITWSLGGWPFIRMLLLMGLLFAFSFSPVRPDLFGFPLLLPSLLILGLGLGRMGLQKCRHGQWQTCDWGARLARISDSAELRGPKRFASPAQAQLWFEWRRFGLPLCLYAAGLVFVPVALSLLTRLLVTHVPLQDKDMTAFTVYLLAVPPFIHFLLGVSPSRGDQSFVLVRSVTNGELTTAALKTAALSAAVSWVAVLAAWNVMPFLGDFQKAQQVAFPEGIKFAVIMGLVFLTWRFIAVALCFVWSGKRWLQGVPIRAAVLTGYAGAIAIAVLRGNMAFWHWLGQWGPLLLVCLLIVKVLLAILAFRISLARRLLDRSALLGYLAIWTLLTAVLLVTSLIVAHPPMNRVLPLVSAVILLVPLARVGFCPIALSTSRHE